MKTNYGADFSWGDLMGHHYDQIVSDAWAGVSLSSLTQKENNMSINADFEGKIKRIGKQFLLQLGCEEFICQNLSAVGSKIIEALTAEYKKRDTRDTPEDE